jgi:membrane-associated protease RseP (regulator of RpoE activity)
MNNSLSPPLEFLHEEAPQKFPWVNVGLFLLTCLTTLTVGTFNSTAEGALGPFFSRIWQTPSILLSGLPFSISVMSILFAHEMGHYLTCRAYGISATLPYFIPAPTIVGTMGAFIKIRAPIQHRRALIDVGIAGPIAGFVVAIPALIIGLHYSTFIVLDPSSNYFSFGEPIIFKLAAYLMGKTPPAGMDLSFNPIALAAWFGFFVTALNLLPVGQLDGGHAAYAIFGKFHQKISKSFVFFLIPLGIFFWQGWLLWTTLLLFIGLRHPVTLDDSVPLGKRHVWLGWIALAMFILCFTPIPFYLS